MYKRQGLRHRRLLRSGSGRRALPALGSERNFPAPLLHPLYQYGQHRNRAPVSYTHLDVYKRQANEVANALAEHTAGSIEAFADMMNERAASLGCTDSHFCNPSGLNNPDHYTSAYDMALIAQAAFQNEAFVTIDSTLYYDLPPTKRNPDGFRIYPGHRMMKKNAPQYYPGIIGGKTGYTLSLIHI